ncbi:NAD-dependent epimerase/dehydratase family protein [Paenibacillus wulumuqiensis]|uniref:NAD-dependent epimerase/dehydratase family protein n=1 Tax=Paenibacillus wulumuqiensis TaxID=1567107 RepID=UPI0006199C6B|nr:NAD-dependent epimerase/dehydratase family protein [Paenibacillus wulumuqiensis]
MGNSALLGYTGFVGSTLLMQTTFDDLYNSKNISEIYGKEYDLIVCAAAPAVKWKANQEPEADINNLNVLMDSLKEVKAQYFVLISTVDVYCHPYNVNENTVIDATATDPYGRHRFYLEEFVKEQFENHLIIRLPGLFGEGLKKNFIYDLIHDNRFDLTHKDSSFQFYNMKNLWKDILKAKHEQITLINFATAPVTAFEIAQHSLNMEFKNITEKPPVRYNMISNHAEKFGDGPNYFKSKEQVLQEITDFIKSKKSEQ